VRTRCAAHSAKRISSFVVVESRCERSQETFPLINVDFCCSPTLGGSVCVLLAGADEHGQAVGNRGWFGVVAIRQLTRAGN
jgi:hypothetical protein